MGANGHKRLNVAVVGGGIAGIAAAEEIALRGHRAELFEAGPRLGGRVALAPLGEREICLGGKNVGRRYQRFRALLERRIEPEYEVFGPDTGQLVRGRVRTLSFRSASMRARVGGGLAAHWQLRQGLRFLRLAGKVREDPACSRLGDSFFTELARHAGDPALPAYLGSVLCRDLVRHMTVRMNGAEPDECHLGNLGTNLGLVVDRFDQLVGDALGEWVRAVEAAHEVHTGTPVASLALAGGRVVGLSTDDGTRHDFDRVVLAVPAHGAARIVAGADPALARLLGTIRYFPVGVVVAQYDRPAFPPAFAALTSPGAMALSNAGSYGLRDRDVVRYTFSGRPARGLLGPDRFDPEALLGQAEAHLARHAPVGEARRLGFAAHVFRPGLCAYRRDHSAFLHAAGAKLAALPGLALAGDYMRGASLEACVVSGEDAAGLVLADRAEPRVPAEPARALGGVIAEPQGARR